MKGFYRKKKIDCTNDKNGLKVEQKKKKNGMPSILH